MLRRPRVALSLLTESGARRAFDVNWWMGDLTKGGVAHPFDQNTWDAGIGAAKRHLGERRLVDCSARTSCRGGMPGAGRGSGAAVAVVVGAALGVMQDRMGGQNLPQRQVVVLFGVGVGVSGVGGAGVGDSGVGVVGA